MRYKVLKELKTKVFALKFMQGGSQIEKSKKSLKLEGEKQVKRKPPLDRDWSETPCCVMLTKPMENILIRYTYSVPFEMENIRSYQILKAVVCSREILYSHV